MQNCLVQKVLIVLWSAMFVSSLLTSGCIQFSGFGGKGDDDSAAEVDPRIVPVRVERPTTADIEDIVTASATVESERLADVFVEVSGAVERIVVDEGDTVRRGTILARLSAPSVFAQTQAAREESEQAEHNLAALQKVHEQGFLSDQEYQAARLRAEQSRAALTNAEENLGRTAMKSPIAGVVAERRLRYGETPAPGTLAFRIMDLEQLRVIVQVPERELPRLTVGQPATVISELQGGVNTEGTVARISPVVDPNSGTVRVTIDLPKGQTVLRPGSFVQVRIVVDTRVGVPVIPKKAITQRDSKSMIFVVRNQQAFQLEPTFGLEGEDVIEVLANGPLPGDQIVVVGQEALEHETPVRVVDSAGAT